MSSTTPLPIALEVKDHSTKQMKVLLSHVVFLDVEDNINTLTIGGTTEKVKVSQKCLDQIRLVVHQFQLYQRIATELQKLPKSMEVDCNVKFYMSLVAYFKDVISAFHGEAKADASSSTSKWRSAYLDYHIALALHGSSFTKDMQITALKEIKRTWTQFREKKGLREIQKRRRMHDAFCVDGENLCGGPFEHKISEHEVISTVIKNVTGNESVQPINNACDSVSNSIASDDVSNTMEDDATMSQKSCDIILIDVDAGDRIASQKTVSKFMSGRLNQDGHQRKSVIAKGSRKTRIEIISVDDESPTDKITSRFESNINSKKNSEERRRSRRPRASKATMLRIHPNVYHSVPQKLDEHKLIQECVQEDIQHWPKGGRNVEEYDDVLLPSIQDGWEHWTKIAFEDGNSHVFLKLATWMLIRFRQLTEMDMDVAIDGVVIPGDPQVMEGVDDDHFFEALGMERMYTAIAHMETSPRYICHLFHALGKVIASSDVSTSNPRLLPCNSPPAVEAQMMSDMEISWIALKDDDTETSPWSEFGDATEDDANESLDCAGIGATQALDCMIIEDSSTSVRPGTDVADPIFPKRKRTLSQVSPPKDGGGGPAKRRKDHAHNVVRSTCVQSSADIEESGFNTSSVVPRFSTISNASSPRDDASVFLEAWDKDTNDKLRTSSSPEEQHESAIPQNFLIPQNAGDGVIRIPTSPLTSGVGIPPSSPVVLVPDIKSSQRQRARHTTPAPPRITRLTERSLEGSVRPGTSLVVGPTPCPDGDSINPNADCMGQDNSELTYVPMIYSLSLHTCRAVCHKYAGRFEKLLYEKILLFDEEIATLFLQCMRRRHTPHAFAQTSIKAISLSDDVQFETAVEILSLCTGMNTLTIIPDEQDFHDKVTYLLQLMGTLPLTVLSLQVNVHPTSSLISDVAFFAKLTHLEIDRCGMLCDVDLQYFPRLTHLAIWSTFSEPDRRAPSLIKRLLSHPTLQVFIIRVDYHRNFANFLDRHMLHDPRIVLAPSRVYLWDDLGRASMLLWELADEAVKLPEPNHTSVLHRTMLVNGIKDFMDDDRVPEHDLDYELFPCRIMGQDGTRSWGYMSNVINGVTMIEE
ncbi:hypothetical protein F4604DRAFT_1675383 [Suillus subluteus]|nr:hypothetical protein F4604DRAFT_1675383 [Suillus subluteus]